MLHTRSAISTTIPVQVYPVRAMDLDFRPSDASPEGRARYSHAGHAKKLGPIIESLDYFDNDPNAWESLQTQIRLVLKGWEHILQTVLHDPQAHQVLTIQRDISIEAMRMQAELFHQHRLTCAAALKLHTQP